MSLPETFGAMTVLIIETARGERGVHPADTSAWDGFYREYEASEPAVQAVADAAFFALASAPDPSLRLAALFHQRQRQSEAATKTLLEIWEKHAALFGAEVVVGSTLRAHFLSALCAMAQGADQPAAMAVLYAAAPGAGALPPSVGTLLGSAGFSAVDRLVTTVKPAKNLDKAVWQAGYIIGRSAALSGPAEKGVLGWPAGLRSEFRSGMEEARRRWGLT